MNPRNGRAWRNQPRPLFIQVLEFTVALAITLLPLSALSHSETGDRRFVQVEAKTKFERSAIAEAGVSIEFTRSDSVWGFATEEAIRNLEAQKMKVLGNFDEEVARGGHEGVWDFPGNDSRFHNYAETVAMLRDLNARNADITRLVSIGKSVEGRDIWAIHINTSDEALLESKSSKPGFIIMGAHHAREHLSVEIPLMFLQHLLNNRQDSRVSALLDQRDIWIIPIVNPDGKEYDIATGRYRMWRKNRRDNRDGRFGVDLNRNYGYKWGTGGSSKDTGNDTYMGPAPFSEPETQAVRDFVKSHLNAKVLLSVHTFSELILYPWGHSYDAIGNNRDLQVFETMARTMAAWNKYTPQQSSDLYIASGDTTDWAYGEHGIFAFTFELSPKSMWDGGFYPGQGVIDRVFNDNLRPLMYMLDVADDPYRVVGNTPSRWLKNYVEPKMDEQLHWERHPLPRF
jgi:carboxypeptidase T